MRPTDRPGATVHHVSLRVDDVPVALAFYRDVLGLTPLARPDLGVPGAWLDAGAVQLHLIEGAPGPATGIAPDRPNPLAAHVAFAAPDAPALLERLVAAGLQPVPGHPDLPQWFVQDPSGNVVELSGQPPADAG